MNRTAGVSALCLCLLLHACGGPLGPIHGGRLAGHEGTLPDDDWTFAERLPHLQIETRPENPYSVNVNFLLVGKRLYIDIGEPDDWNRWRRFAHRNPQVRIRAGDTVYAARLVPIVDGIEMRTVREAYAAKHGAPPGPGVTLVRAQAAAGDIRAPR